MSSKPSDSPKSNSRRGDTFVDAFAKGLTIIRTFNQSKEKMTLSEVAERAELPAATTRRLLYTLVNLGYARQSNKRFELSPKILDLGYSYLTSLPFHDIAHALLDDFARNMKEVCSVSMLEGNDVVYVVRTEVRTPLARNIGVGGRLPAHATSSGLILLAALPADAIDAYLQQAPFEAHTPKTRVTADAIREAIAFIHENGWMRSSEELELGVCGLAVPIQNLRGETAAALGVSINLARYNEEEILQTFLPKLREIAAQIGPRCD